MQAGFNEFGKLYIKFAMNFAIPLAKGSQDFISPTVGGMKNMAEKFIGKKFVLHGGGPEIGTCTDVENPVFGHYIFVVTVDDRYKDIVLKILQLNHPSISSKLHDAKGELTLEQKEVSVTKPT